LIIAASIFVKKVLIKIRISQEFTINIMNSWLNGYIKVTVEPPLCYIFTIGHDIVEIKKLYNIE